MAVRDSDSRWETWLGRGGEGGSSLPSSLSLLVVKDE